MLKVPNGAGVLQGVGWKNWMCSLESCSGGIFSGHRDKFMSTDFSSNSILVPLIVDMAWMLQ